MKYLIEIIDEINFEDKEYEFKIKLDSEVDKIEKWAKTIVAFANTIGGTIFVGVNDEGIAVGLSKTDIDDTKRLVLKSIDRYIFPHIDIDFEIYETCETKYILVIRVEYINELIIFRSGDYNEKVYIRENGSTVVATVAKILRIGKRKLGIDDQIINEQYSRNRYKIFNLLATKYRLDNKEPSFENLISEEIINKDGRIKQGLKMFADDYNSDDTLLVLRLWNGYDKGIDEVLDKKELKGSIAIIFEESLKFILRNSRSGFIKASNGARLDTLSYPLIALREALVNALAHRDYSIDGTQIDIDIYKDRLEITSPGSWLLDKRASNYDLEHIPSVRRNKILCNCFEMIGLMEKSGSGFKKILRSYEQFKKPLIDENEDYFVITLFDILADQREVNNRTSKYDTEILNFCDGIARSREEIQLYIGYSSRRHFMNNILKPLLDKGLIMQTAPSKSKNQKYIKIKNISL